MRFFILLGLVTVAFGQLPSPGQGGQGGYSGGQGGQGGYSGGQDFFQQPYVFPGQQQYVLPGPQQQYYQYQLPYSYQQFGYNPWMGIPQTQYPYQVGVQPVIQSVLKETVPIPVEYPVIKEIDVIQPGISGAIPLTTMDAALLELEDKDYGHYEKYYYGRSGIPQGFVRPIRRPGMSHDGKRLRSGAGESDGIPINRYMRPGANNRQPPFKVSKREHYEIYKYH